MKLIKDPNAVAQPEKTKTFIGKAWVNTVAKQDSKYFGVKFLSIRLDNKLFEGANAIELVKGDELQLWPNTKRDGKKDADFRLSVISTADATAEATETPVQESIF
jgi:uncharacterized protein (DUF736 family)